MTGKNEDGWKDEGLDCLILDEFLLPAPLSKLDKSTFANELCSVGATVTGNEETLSGNRVEKELLSDENVIAHDGKENQKRGRNKKRPPPLKFDRSSKLCPVYVDVSPERDTLGESSANKLPQCTFPNCQFQHNAKAYIENKRPDISDDCLLYKTYGRCEYGLACRFASSHTIILNDGDVRNKVNREIYSEFNKDKYHKELNHLPKDLQIKLRKKEYNFKYSDKVVDEAFKARQEKQESGNSSMVEENGTDRNDPPQQSESSNSAISLLNTTEPETKKVKTECNLGIRPTNPVDPGFELARKKIDWKNKLYLAPLTTVGNLPFRRICKKFGADITCGEMAMSLQLLQGHQPEWALVQRHESEDIFGIQLCGPSPQQMARVAQLVDDGRINCDFVDINLGCPIDLVYTRGMGSGLMARKKPLEVMVRSMAGILARSQIPLTIKMRTGVYSDKHLAHTLAPMALKEWGASMVTIHGRSREQRYTRSADWKYLQRCARASNEDNIVNEYGGTVPIFGNGDIVNYEDYNNFRSMAPDISGVMIARGALIKPWVFTEIKEQRHWDISASERLDMIRDYANYGLEHWGSDDKGVETTRRFLLEWLSFLHRYVPHGILASPPQRINERVPKYFRGRSDIETLLSSPVCDDWIKISEMFLGKPPDNFRFEPKHKAHAYRQS